MAGTANVLAFHTIVSTLNHFVTLVTPEVVVIIVTIGYLLITGVADMIRYRFMIAIYHSVAVITVIITVSVDAETNEYSMTFISIAISVIIIVAAIERHQCVAIIAHVIVIGIIVIGFIGILSALRFLVAKVTNRVLIRINVYPAGELVFTFVTVPIVIGVGTNVGHPLAAVITVVVTVSVGMNYFVITVTERGILTFVTSSVTHALATHVAHPYTTVVAVVVIIFVAVEVVIIDAPSFCLTVVTDSVFILVNVACARHHLSAYVTNAVSVLVNTRNCISANVTLAIAIPVCAKLVEALIAYYTIVAFLVRN